MNFVFFSLRLFCFVLSLCNIIWVFWLERLQHKEICYLINCENDDAGYKRQKGIKAFLGAVCSSFSSVFCWGSLYSY